MVARLRLVRQHERMDTGVVVDLLPAYTTWLESWGAAASTVRVRTSVLARALAEAGDDRGALLAWLARYPDRWTASSYHSHLRSFFSWAVEAGHLESDPLAGVRRPRAPRATPRPLTAEQAHDVVEAAAGRTLAYVLLGLLAGLRAHEVAKIRGEDVSADSIYVLGKGNQVAYVPTHPDLWQLAQEYPRRSWWFPSPVLPGNHVTASAVSAAVSQVLRGLGLPGSHHRLRHTYGTALLASGANLRVVQELMRHESVTSTQMYTRVTDDERRRAVERLVA